MDIRNIIKDLVGKEIVSFSDLTGTWLEWYKGNVTNFHEYQDYNGVKKLTCNRKTLNMPKKICEDWANLLLNEKTDVVLEDDKQQQALWNLLNKVHFWTKGNEGIEKTFALGTGAFVESFDELGNARLQFVNAQKIYPITIDQDKITECAFVNANSGNTVIQIHLKDGFDNYSIRTLTYKKDLNDTSDTLGNIVRDDLVETGTDIAWFQIVKPNIANNIDINSPMGISIFANAVDTLAGVDLSYDGFCEEMRLGKGKIFVDKQLTSYIEGGQNLVFDVNTTGFYYVGNGSDNKQPLTFYNPQLRTDSYFNGINNALNLLSSKVGFGANHYRFDQSGITTATQVISQNSDMFRSLRKHEIILDEVIRGVCKALMYINNEFTDNVFKFNLEGNLEVKFDDSIIEDKEAQKMADRQDVNMGVMSKVEYRVKWYNEDEETAREEIEKIKEENMSNYTNFFSASEE